jgi:uncharacterized protein (UPF0335 family)
MSEKEQRGLQRLDFESKLPVRFQNLLPAGFQSLTEDEQRGIIKKLLEQDTEIHGEILRKVGKSQVAENDLNTAIDIVERLDHERKIYSKHVKGENGSGSFELQIRGGDTKFILPVLAVIGAIILAIILIIRLT